MDLVDLLESEGLAERLALSRARAKAERTRAPLVAVLVDAQAVAEDGLADALARAVGSVVIDVDHGELDEESVGLVPEAIARRHLLVAVALDPDGQSLRVAFANPLDQAAVDAVRDVTGLELQPLVATVSAVRAAIERAYHTTRSIEAPGHRGADDADMVPEITRRVEVPPGDATIRPRPPEPSIGTAPLYRMEHEATIEQRHEALLLALVEAGVITRADYLAALQRLLGRPGR